MDGLSRGSQKAVCRVLGKVMFWLQGINDALWLLLYEWVHEASSSVGDVVVGDTDHAAYFAVFIH